MFICLQRRVTALSLSCRSRVVEPIVVESTGSDRKLQMTWLISVRTETLRGFLERWSKAFWSMF